jgi:hypothetical protein
LNEMDLLKRADLVLGIVRSWVVRGFFYKL